MTHGEAVGKDKEGLTNKPPYIKCIEAGSHSPYPMTRAIATAAAENQNSGRMISLCLLANIL